MSTQFAVGNAVQITDGKHEGIEGEITAIAAGWITVESGEGEVRCRAAQLELVDEDDREGEVEFDPTDVEQDDDEDEGEQGGSNLAIQMRKHRAGYVAGTNATGSKTLTNGDELAIALLALLPLQVCAAADALFEVPAGTHARRYASLNPGQQRMNAGNRLRAALRKAESEEARQAVADAIEAGLASPIAA